MSKALILTRKALMDAKGTMIAGAVGVFLIMLLHVAIYPEYGDQPAMQYPEALSGLFGQAGSVGVVQGYLAGVSTNCLALVAILAIIVGTSATAGEESAGTLDLMLAQPVLRWRFMLSKAAGLGLALSVAALAAVPAFALGNLRADLSIANLSFFAATVSMLPAALIFLAIALLAGVTLPSRGSATVAASGAVVLLYFVTAAGNVGPLETVRKVSPFYWTDASHVLLDGFDWLRSGVLLIVAAALLGLSAYALQRREVAAGTRETGGWWTAIRSRGRGQTHAGVVDPRLGGWFSRSYGLVRKTAADVRGPVFAAALASFGFAVLLVLIYPSYRDALKDFEYPGALQGLLGEAGSFSSPAGYMSGEFFGFAPLIFIAVAIVLGTGAIAGEEASGTLDFILAQPLQRRRLLIHKTVVIAAGLLLAAAAGIPGYLLGRLFVDMDLSALRFIEATVSVSLLTLVFLALALWAGATLPSRGAAAMFVTALVVAGYLLNTLSFTEEWLRTPNKLSPFYWADASHVLVSGIDWLRAAALVATTSGIFVLALRSLERRDIVTGQREWRLLNLVRLRIGSLGRAR